MLEINFRTFWFNLFQIYKLVMFLNIRYGHLNNPRKNGLRKGEMSFRSNVHNQLKIP